MQYFHQKGIHLCIHWLRYGMATKDVGLRVRVERELRDDFLEACRAHDRPAAQVIREFMRDYVVRHAVENSPMSNFNVRKRARSKANE